MCVRFSNNEGLLLAIGTDDSRVLILEQDFSGRGSFGHHNIENWRTRAMLSGHSKDVVDVAWSTHNTYLASASFDGHVVVWDVEAGFVKHQVVDTTAIMCRSVVWDPVEKYLAVYVCVIIIIITIISIIEWTLMVIIS